MNKSQAHIEAEKIIDNYIEKEKAIIEEAKKNGTWQPGLDANNNLFREIVKERNEKLSLLSSMVDKE